MASKSVPAKKKPTSATDESQEASSTTDKTDITTVKKATCNNLLGTATLGYEIGIQAETSALYWRVSSNTGNGYWSRAWVKFTDIQKALTDWPKDLPLTSMALRPLFTGSVNTSSFLLATLVNEGVLEPVPDNLRHFQIGNLNAVAELQSSHSKPAKAKPRAKAKAAARMPKTKAKPAAGK
tara:strand:+ start:1713 stop:2255 length:543 start_codon:yes stop_codon:yes gene_type:complete